MKPPEHPIRPVLNFDLKIRPNGPKYKHEAIPGPDGKPKWNYRVVLANDLAGTESISHDIDLKEIEGDFSWLSKEWDSRQWGQLKITEDGGSLFSLVFASEALKLYRRFEREAEAHGAILRIRLDLAKDTRLLGLPWEYLFDREHSTFVLSSPLRSLVRVFGGLGSPLAPVKQPIQVLATTSPLANSEAMTKGTVPSRNIIRFMAIPSVETEFLDLTDPKSFPAHLAGQDIDVLNYGSHTLALKDSTTSLPSGPQNLLSRSDLESVRLVVLDPPPSGVPSFLQHQLSPLELVHSGVPAVVSLHRPLSDIASNIFVQQLYSSLAKGNTVDGAVSQVRQRLAQQIEGPEWGVPVVSTWHSAALEFGLREDHEGNPLEPIQELEDLRNELLTDWMQTTGQQRQQSQQSQQSLSPANQKLVDGYLKETADLVEQQTSEVSPQGESTKPSRPPKVWMFANHPNKRDWRQATANKSYSFTPNRPQEMDVFNEVNHGDIVVLFHAGEEQSLVGWGELIPRDTDRLGKVPFIGKALEKLADGLSPDIALRGVLKTSIPFETLKRACADLRYVKRRGRLTPVPRPEWTKIRELMRFHNPALESELPEPLPGPEALVPKVELVKLTAPKTIPGGLSLQTTLLMRNVGSLTLEPEAVTFVVQTELQHPRPTPAENSTWAGSPTEAVPPGSDFELVSPHFPIPPKLGKYQLSFEIFPEADLPDGSLLHIVSDIQHKFRVEKLVAQTKSASAKSSSQGSPPRAVTEPEAAPAPPAPKAEATAKAKTKSKASSPKSSDSQASSAKEPMKEPAKGPEKREEKASDEKKKGRQPTLVTDSATGQEGTGQEETLASAPTDTEDGALALDPATPDLTKDLASVEAGVRKQIVQVYQNVHNTVALRVERAAEVVASNTLDIHIVPRVQRRTQDVLAMSAPAAEEALQAKEAEQQVAQDTAQDSTEETTPEYQHSVVLTLHRHRDGSAADKRFYDGPLQLGNLSRSAGRGDQRYGRELHKAVFHSTLPPERDRWVKDPSRKATLLSGYSQALGAAQAQPLRIQLRIDPSLPELHRHAWEYFVDDASGLGKPLACHPKTPFARVLHVSGKAEGKLPRIGKENKLRMLMVRASPEILETRPRFAPGPLKRLGPVDKADLEAVVESLRDLPGLESPDATTGKHILQSGEALVTLEALHQTLANAQPGYQVLHLLCHGTHSSHSTGQQRGLLVMDRENLVPGQDPLVDEEEFASLMATHVDKGLRLIVLASCFSGQLTGDDEARAGALRGVARRLVEAGVPAVVAMQDTLQIEGAQYFSQRLYRHLVHSGEIDKAVNAARLELYAKRWKGNKPEKGKLRPDEWGIPVLFMRLPDGRLFEVDETPDGLGRLEPDRQIKARPYEEMPSADPERLHREAVEMASAAVGSSLTLDPRDLARTFAEALRSVQSSVQPVAPPAAVVSVGNQRQGTAGEKPAPPPPRLFPDDRGLRWALLQAAAHYRRDETRRTVLFLRSRARRRIARLVREIQQATVGRKAVRQELQQAFLDRVASSGEVQIGATTLTAKHLVSGSPELSKRPLLVWREADRGYRSQAVDGSLEPPEKLSIDGSLWQQEDAPEGVWENPTVKSLQALLDPNLFHYGAFLKLLEQPSSNGLTATQLALLLHGWDSEKFAPFPADHGKKIFASPLADAAPTGEAYAADYSGFNQLVRDLLRDPDMGLANTADAALFLERLEPEQLSFEGLEEELSNLETRPAVLPRRALRDVHLNPALLDTQLVVPPRALDQAMAALAAGKHVILTGPPGTGKTTLAEDLCRLAFDREANRGHVLATATSDWTTFDTIGGDRPKRDGQLAFRPGVFLDAVRAQKWLIIDEINRADIDKAFGELFTVLSGQAVTLPYLAQGRPVKILPAESTSTGHESEFEIPESWRIVATMNVYDRASLFAMSKAFMRRFAFVEVDIPEPDVYAKLISDFMKRKRLRLSDPGTTTLQSLFRKSEGDASNALMQWRSLGPAIALDIIRYLVRRIPALDELKPSDADRQRLERKELADALALYVVPQLEDLEKEAVTQILDLLTRTFPGETNLTRRVKDLFPYFSFEIVDS
ncbi:MAG: CHAT domain-containing protein [Deltaproteobacteria bacterium]|nr:CHAT domain-containing protein [Deltaproteobacteria bacterium]